VTRFVTALAVLVVAAVAGLISFGHVEVLALTSGQTLVAARCLPVSIDGLVVASSMVLLDYARRGIPAPVLARVLLGLGVAATLTANAAAGASHGVAGVAVSMWPAVAFIGSAEAFLTLVRGQAQAVPEEASERVPEAVPDLPVPAVPKTVPDTVPEAPPARTRTARRALPRSRSRARGVHRPEVVFAAELEAGQLPGIRVIKNRMKVGQDKAREYRAFLEGRLSAPRETVEAVS
jgi:Protein of unknown function (DUF2637)